MLMSKNVNNDVSKDSPTVALTSLLEFALSALLKLVLQNGHPLGTITYVTTASVNRNSFPQFYFTKGYNYECFMRSYDNKKIF